MRSTSEGSQCIELAVEVMIDAIEIDAFRGQVKASPPFPHFFARHHVIGRDLYQHQGQAGATSPESHTD